MIGCVVGTGSRELLLPGTPWSATFLEIAFWGVVGVGGLVLLVLLVEAVEFVQKAFREGHSWAAWVSWNRLSIFLLVVATATVARLLRDPSPFLSQGVSKPAVARWQLWVLAAGCLLLAWLLRVNVGSAASAGREAEPSAGKDREAD